MSLIAQYRVVRGDNKWSRHRVPEALLGNGLHNESLKPSSDWQLSLFYNVTAVYQALVVCEHSWDLALTIYINGNYCTFVWTSWLTLRHNSKLLSTIFILICDLCSFAFWKNPLYSHHKIPRWLLKNLDYSFTQKHVSVWKQTENCRTLRNHVLTIVFGTFF